ncbi:NADH-quinone oxidoreductase subunit G [Helicobacter mehlei]|uniref:NADH-quinone oxidoreductase subunit G n=1 Tax=Helicobacter mehlei TaxID=2316080 RepID=A0A553UX14_9HELI|nr:NADH-quinone oxidoreductase subunit G [Helicobacter mehlei]TSA84744.1 NADH-quinone oxidoreductase subunit G [Helicobacter mehlei]
MPSVEIDGQSIEFKDGQTILEAARSAGVYIPAICYLSGCSPTVACKMCMVEVDGKRVYGCNTKAKPNSKICTNTPAIKAERKMIMQTYDVNHPLECGVCDKSGECELQDMTMRMQVETQPFAVRDNLKPFAFWAQASYDPNLCIMCERCVTTCSDNIGDSNLKALKADLHAPDKFKASMPKDPFSVWNRKQKGMIGFVGDTPCFDCGECIAVCPVGAIVYKDFSYKANAWELKHIDSTCMHCAAGCLIDYEVRHFDTLGEDQKIFRVGNDFYHNPICGAGRFAFDCSSSKEGSPDLLEAVQRFKEAKSVLIGGDLLNEEAYLIEYMRAKLGFKLYNEPVRLFQEFLNTFSVPCESTENIRNANAIFTLGTQVKNENPLIKYAISNALKVNKASLIYAHPILDQDITKICRSVLPICLHGVEEVILGALMLALNVSSPCLESILAGAYEIPQASSDPEKPAKPKTFYKLLEESGLSLEIYDKMQGFLAKANQIALVVGKEIYTHARAQNMALMLQEIAKHPKIKIILIPPTPNALGIASICQLDKQESLESPSVGVRTRADYTLDSDFNQAYRVDFILPSFNQLEGSTTNFEGHLLPLRPALKFEGYDLSDIAQHFGLLGESLVDYTHLLPQEKGYQPIAYDDLLNAYGNDKSNLRGYALKITQQENPAQAQPISPSTPLVFNAYCQYPQSQFGLGTLFSQNLQLKEGIYTSKAHLESLGLAEGARICLSYRDLKLEGPLFVDHALEQAVFVVSPSLDVAGIFKDSWFANLQVESV